MAFTPNLAPNYAVAPLAFGPVAFPSTAKTVLTDTSNAVKIVSASANNRQVITALWAEVAITLSAGKLLAFLYNGTTAFQVDDVPHSNPTISTTAGTSAIAFKFSTSNPLIVPEGAWEVWLASAVAQSAGALIGYGTGKLF